MQQLNEKPKPGQVWRTNKGHAVRIIVGTAPGPQSCIESAYVKGRINGRLGENFDLGGKSIHGDDWLVERLK